jgi:hypothetical protein
MRGSSSHRIRRTASLAALRHHCASETAIAYGLSAGDQSGALPPTMPGFCSAMRRLCHPLVRRRRPVRWGSVFAQSRQRGTPRRLSISATVTHAACPDELLRALGTRLRTAPWVPRIGGLGVWAWGFASLFRDQACLPGALLPVVVRSAAVSQEWSHIADRHRRHSAPWESHRRSGGSHVASDAR